MSHYSLAIPLRNMARRLFSFVAYRFWVKPRSLRTHETKLLGFRMIVPPTVFHPRYFFTSKFMAEYLQGQDFKGQRILEIGCGSGILSLVVASRGGQVTSIDINPSAVYATESNAETNNLSRNITTREGDLFNALDSDEGPFDFVISNPPYYSGIPNTTFERAFKGGSNNDFMTRIASDLPKFLRPNGEFVIVISSDVDSAQLLRPFSGREYSIRIVKSKKLKFETLSILRIRRAANTTGMSE